MPTTTVEWNSLHTSAKQCRI